MHAALKIAGSYAVVAACWILFSDPLVDRLGLGAIVHTYKGLAFVLTTSVVLFVLLRREFSRRAKAEAAQRALSESKSRMIAAISHDLRQPLQSLALFTSVIQTQGDLSARSRSALDNLGQTQERMGALLNSILDLARADLGVLAASRQWIAVNDVIQPISTEMRPLAEAKGLRLRCVTCRILVESDPVLLASILRNLVANAIRYTEAGGIVVGCRRKGKRLALMVYDTGIGIDPEKLDLVFEEFYQVGNTGRDSSLGLGLGLSIVDRMCRILGHKVVMRSRKGRGSAIGVVMEAKV